MLLLEKDPLLDFENTRTIVTVVTKGVVLATEDIKVLIQESADPSPAPFINPAVAVPMPA